MADLNSGAERGQVRQAMITGVRWLATVRLIAQVSSWIITFIVVRLLTPTDYGLQAMVTVIFTLLLLLSQSGFDRAIARVKDFGDLELRQMLGLSLLLNTLLMLIVWSMAPGIATYYSEPQVTPLLRVLSVAFVLHVLSRIPLGLVYRRLDYRRHAISGLIGTVSTSISTLILALMGFGVWALILGQVISPLASALYLQLTTRWLVMPQLRFDRVWQIARYAWTMSLSFFVWTVAMRLDVFIGGRALPAAELGFYAVAIHLCGLPLAKILPLANEVLYPAYAKLQSDADAVSGYFRKSLSSLSLLLFPAFLGLAAIAEWAVPIILGANWRGVEHIILIVALAMPFRVVTSMCNPMLHASGQAGVTLHTGVFSALFIGFAVYIGAQWGTPGLAVATLVAAPVVMVVVVWQTQQVSGMSMIALAKTVGPPLAISAVMAIIVHQLGRAISGTLPDWLLVTIQVATGIIIYVILSALITRKAFLATVGIFHTVLKSRKTTG